jgi:hypothetical protein
MEVTMAKKSKRELTPANPHFATLRQAANLYYTSGGENPEPWAKPTSAVKPKRKRVSRTPAKG